MKHNIFIRIFRCIVDILFPKQEWEYGTAEVFPQNGRPSHIVDPARRDTKTGHVQFILWKAGHKGHKEDYWYDMEHSHWSTFKLNKIEKEE